MKLTNQMTANQSNDFERDARDIIRRNYEELKGQLLQNAILNYCKNNTDSFRRDKFTK